MKIITNKINLGVSGIVEASRDKKILDKGNNIITNNGLKNILLLLINGANRPNYIEVGLGVSAVAITDTVMTTTIPPQPLYVNADPTLFELVDNARDSIDTASYSVFPSENITAVRINRKHKGSGKDNLNGLNLSEIGLFDRRYLGNMFAHRLFDTVIGVDKESDLNLTWNIYICRDSPQNSGYILNSGLEILGDLFSNQNLSFENNDQDSPMFYRYRYYPRGLNYGVVGRNGNPSQNDSIGIVSEVLRNPIANFCLEEVSVITNIAYRAKLVLQQMIPAFSFTGTIAEAGLYRVRKEYKGGGEAWGGDVASVPFCRAVFDPVDASEDICLTWEFSISNQPITF